jgi:hypothetical protein
MQATGEARQLFRMLQPSYLVFQLLILARAQVRRFDLACLKAQVIRAGFRLASAPLEIGERLASAAQPSVRDAYCVGQLSRSGKRIQHGALLLDAQKSLVLVLAVQVHQQSANLGKQSGRAGGAVHPGAAPAFGRNLPPQNQQTFFTFDPLLLQQLIELGTIRDIEHPFNNGFPCATANCIRRGSFAQQKRERTNDDGLSRARFTRKRVESVVQAHGKTFDDREVFDAKFEQHGASIGMARRAHQ